ncbi:hypothetical protein PR048_031437 [Dryococelus australis]|uniref:Uncharacterized protein n=1 Tax=Dryococelus australis TaxID=614101 RepID=A0ABQ9G5A6_9NEOP|nr:hypothetical protein PR048_031437 [Dryococelus australis]
MYHRAITPDNSAAQDGEAELAATCAPLLRWNSVMDKMIGGGGGREQEVFPDEYGEAPEREWRGKRELPEKPTDRRHRSARSPREKIRKRPRRDSNPVRLGGRRVVYPLHHCGPLHQMYHRRYDSNFPPLHCFEAKRGSISYRTAVVKSDAKHRLFLPSSRCKFAAAKTVKVTSERRAELQQKTRVIDGTTARQFSDLRVEAMRELMRMSRSPLALPRCRPRNTPSTHEGRCEVERFERLLTTRSRESRVEQRRNAREGKREIPEKTRRQAASSGTIPTCENQGATRPGMESGSALVGGEQANRAANEAPIKITKKKNFLYSNFYKAVHEHIQHSQTRTNRNRLISKVASHLIVNSLYEPRTRETLTSSMKTACKCFAFTEQAVVIWAALNIEVLRADEGEARQVWSSTGMKRRENPHASGFVRHNFHMRKSERSHREPNPVSPSGRRHHDGNTARLARRSDEALGVRVSVARIASSLFDLGRGVPTGWLRANVISYLHCIPQSPNLDAAILWAYLPRALKHKQMPIRQDGEEFSELCYRFRMDDTVRSMLQYKTRAELLRQEKTSPTVAYEGREITVNALDKCVRRHVQRVAVGPALIDLLVS